MVEVYIGDSGSGKTEAVRNKIYEILTGQDRDNIRHVYIIGKNKEWDIFNPEMVSVWKNIDDETFYKITDSIIVIDDREYILRDKKDHERLLQICSLAAKKNNKIYLLLSSSFPEIMDKWKTDIFLISNKLYIGSKVGYSLAQFLHQAVYKEKEFDLFKQNMCTDHMFFIDILDKNYKTA